MRSYNTTLYLVVSASGMLFFFPRSLCSLTDWKEKVKVPLAKGTLLLLSRKSLIKSSLIQELLLEIAALFLLTTTATQTLEKCGKHVELAEA